MQRRYFIKGAATCAAGLATGLNLFAQQTCKTSAVNLTDVVDLSGARNLGEKLVAMTPYLTLNNRFLMPIVGLSTGKFDDLKDKSALGAALGLGYRLIDTDGARRERLLHLRLAAQKRAVEALAKTRLNPDLRSKFSEF